MTDYRALCAELHSAFNTYAVAEEHHQLLVRARAALAEPQGPARNCWHLCPSSCVFDDPQETIDNCTYARKLHVEGKCKTDCQYYQPTSENA